MVLHTLPPYRLDFTVEVLRRLSANVVDLFDGQTYRRAFAGADGIHIMKAVQSDTSSLEVDISGNDAASYAHTARTMLGADADLTQWYERVERIGWLRELAQRFCGVKPPRYPTLFEAIAHAIVFQQISIAAAGSIMRRVVMALSEPVEDDGVTFYPFFSPRAILEAPERRLQSAGLSAPKVHHLRAAAAAVENGLSESDLTSLDSVDASRELQKVSGIGPWSAALVLLRGLGRLDVFPLKDSGVARSLAIVTAGRAIDADALLRRLGPVRGMLYFHLLLGRIYAQ